MEVNLSVDMVIVEYTKVSYKFFNKYVIKGLYHSYHSWFHPNNDKAFHYNIHLTNSNGNTIFIRYKKMTEKKAKAYSLWVKTNPKSTHEFIKVFDTFRENAREVRFAVCDVAFDIPKYLTRVLPVPLTGRKQRFKFDTTYYGEPKQRLEHGFLKFYDKKAEQLANYNQVIDGELSRVEITYKSYYSERLLMRELLARPPDFSNIYKCFIIDDIKSVPERSREMVTLLLAREKTFQEYKKDEKAVMKKDLYGLPEVDFHQIALKQWKEHMNPFVSLIVGGKF